MDHSFLCYVPFTRARMWTQVEKAVRVQAAGLGHNLHTVLGGGLALTGLQMSVFLAGGDTIVTSTAFANLTTAVNTIHETDLAVGRSPVFLSG